MTSLRPRRRIYLSDTDSPNLDDCVNEQPIASNTFQNNVISTEDLREYFECPVCFLVPRKPPIYACVRGHMICASCKPRIDICPTCRVPFDVQPYRLYFAERLLEERVPIACRFADDGCKVELPGAAMKKHEDDGCPYEMIYCSKRENGCKIMISRRLMASHVENCEYRLVDCPLSPSCKEKVVKKRLLNHLETIHISKGLFGRTNDSFSNLLLIALVLLCFLSFIINLFFFIYYVN